MVVNPKENPEKSGLDVFFYLIQIYIGIFAAY